MDYSALTTAEPLHYGEIDAKTSLEVALVAAWRENVGAVEALQEEIRVLEDDKQDPTDISGQIARIRAELHSIEIALTA